MTEFTDTNDDAWRAELHRASSMCATFYARRVPNWIAIGNRIWAAQMEYSPKVGLSLPEELMYSARREIELRGDFTRRTFGEYAASAEGVAPTVLLVECTSTAS